MPEDAPRSLRGQGCARSGLSKNSQDQPREDIHSPLKYLWLLLFFLFPLFYKFLLGATQSHALSKGDGFPRAPLLLNNLCEM